MTKNGKVQFEISSEPISTIEQSHASEENSLACGFFGITPRWLQYLHNAKMLLIIISCGAIIQGFIVNGLLPSVLSTIEKRFYLDSTKLGVWAVMYDLSVLLMLLPLSYFGRKVHKGKCLGFGFILMGFGILINIIPQFIVGDWRKNLDSASSLTCSVNQTNCYTDYIKNMQNMWYVFLLGNFITGIGASPIYTYGLVYLDESVSQKASGIYCGLFNAMASFGPALGFVLGGQFLRNWGDSNRVAFEDTPIYNMPEKEQERYFYGNWWIGFLIAGIISLLNSIPMLAFARELPGAKMQRLKDVVQVDSHHMNDEGFDQTPKQMAKAILSLLRNTTFVCLVIVQTVDSFLLNGMTTFIPKIFETLFSLSKTVAPVLAGAVIIPTTVLGTILSGYLIKRFNWHCRQMLLAVSTFSSIAFCFSFVLLIDCPQPTFAGINVAYPIDASNVDVFTLNASCNSNCSCQEQYAPVCDKSNGIQYASACFAGCKHIDDKHFADCACVPDASALLDSGKCEPRESCTSRMIIFLCLFAIVVFVTFLSAQPIQQAVLRSVPFQQRTLGLATSWLFMRAFGSIPGAIVFGYAFDNTCVIWRTDPCLASGENQAKMSCELYDTRFISLAILIIALSVKITQVVSMLFAAYVYKPMMDTISAPNIQLLNIQEKKMTSNNNNSRIGPVKDSQTVVQQF